METDVIGQGSAVVIQPVGESQQGEIEELEKELLSTEEDIQTLKEALALKIRRLVDIKKRLGHTDFSTISYDVREGFQRFSESDTFQKTSRVLEQAGTKTLGVAGDVKDKVVNTIQTLKNSDAYKNWSESVGSALGSVKSAIVQSTYGTLPEEGD